MTTTMEQPPYNSNDLSVELVSLREAEIREQTLAAVASYAVWCEIEEDTPHCIRSDN